MNLELPSEFKYMTWFGSGPHETYWDRKTSGKNTLYKGGVWEQFHAYPRPQESGNKTDVRWVALLNQEGIDLLAVGEELLSTSAWPFSMDDLDYSASEKGAESASGLVPLSSKQGVDVQPKDFITWNIDYKQMGVGGDTAWGRLVHKEHTLPSKNYGYSFILVPISKNGSLNKSARDAKAMQIQISKKDIEELT